MRVQRPRADSLPLTWEVPATIASCWLLASVLALPLGQAIGFWVSGGGFAWPHGTLVENVAGLLRGDVGSGLTVPTSTTVPPPELVYAAITLFELAVGVVAVLAFVVWWRSAGPGAQVGMAGRHDVEQVLGLRNLRRRQATIRPDLYRPHRVPTLWRRRR